MNSMIKLHDSIMEDIDLIGGSCRIRLHKHTSIAHKDGQELIVVPVGFKTLALLPMSKSFQAVRKSMPYQRHVWLCVTRVVNAAPVRLSRMRFIPLIKCRDW